MGTQRVEGFKYAVDFHLMACVKQLVFIISIGLVILTNAPESLALDALIM